MSPELESLVETLRHSETHSAPAPRSCSTNWESLEPRGFYARRGRKLLDATLLVLTIAPLAALFVIVALVNLLYFRDPRRILFVQKRIGRRGRPFRIYKFRTMRSRRFSELDSWVHGYDREHVTLLGTFLRSTHLDEVPQILNILKGEMSFIGPRPEMVEIEAWASEHIEGFSRRLALQPGLTGYAQITQGYTGRSIEAYSEKLDINERYRENYSLALDLEILARTAVWLLCCRGWNWKVHGMNFRLRAASLRPRSARLRRAIGEKAERLARNSARSAT